MRLSAVNALDQSEFVAVLGGVFEHSPWVAAAVWSQRPFATIGALHAAMVAAMLDAPEAQQLALVRAHPELAGKAAVPGAPSADSYSEQSAAGLLQCSAEELARLQALNSAYHRKFGFPFIVAVKGLDRAQIIERFAARLERDRDAEFHEALAQIERIARLRLEALLEQRQGGSAMPTHRDPIDALPAPIALAALGLQHVLSMAAGAIAVPLLVGGALRLPLEQLAFLVNAALFACGIATLLQSAGVWRIGVRLPVMMGLAFTAAAPLVAVATGGVTLNGLFGAVMVAGLFAVAVAPFAGQLRRYFPPLVSGTIVTMIGITLLRIGINWAGGGAAAKNFGDPANLAVVALVAVTILVVNRLFTGLIAQLAVLLGLGIGYVVAMAFGLVDFLAVREASWVALVYPLRFGAPAFEAGAVLSLCVVMLVVMIESSGLFLALGEICGRRIGPPELGSGLAAVGLGTLIAGLCNSFPVAAVAQNVGLVGVSGVRSRWAAAAAGGILVVIGSLPKLGALVASIPQPVLGGAALVLFGMLAATGIKILAGVDFAMRHNLLIIAVSIAVGLIPLAAPTFFAQAPRLLAPLLNSGITLAALSATLLNAWFNGDAAAVDAEPR